MTQCTHGTYSRLGRCPETGTERLTEIGEDVTGDRAQVSCGECLAVLVEEEKRSHDV